MSLPNSLRDVRVKRKVPRLAEDSIWRVCLALLASGPAASMGWGRRVKAALLPERTGPVNVEDRLGNFVGSPKIFNGLPAVWQRPIVIDDHVAPIGDSVIQMFQSLQGGSIHISIEPKNGNSLNRRRGEGVLEPARQETNLFVQQPVTLEVGLNLFDRDCQIPAELMMPVPGIPRVQNTIGSREALEGVGQPYVAAAIAVRFQYGAHENGGSPAPHTCFHQVAWNTVLQYVHNACLQAIEPEEAHHGFRLSGPVSSLNPVGDRKRARGREIVMEIAVREKYSCQAPLEKVKIQFRRAAGGRRDCTHNLSQY